MSKSENLGRLEALSDAKRGWTEPKLTRMRANDAEMAGANPIIPEGAFALGS